VHNKALAPQVTQRNVTTGNSAHCVQYTQYSHYMQRMQHQK